MSIRANQFYTISTSRMPSVKVNYNNSKSDIFKDFNISNIKSKNNKQSSTRNHKNFLEYFSPGHSIYQSKKSDKIKRKIVSLNRLITKDFVNNGKSYRNRPILNFCNSPNLNININDILTSTSTNKNMININDYKGKKHIQNLAKKSIGIYSFSNSQQLSNVKQKNRDEFNSFLTEMNLKHINK